MIPILQRFNNKQAKIIRYFWSKVEDLILDKNSIQNIYNIFQ